MADAAAYVSAAAEHRRKKTALDKARANYLCSQLRLRLQYAKLKVDHGWQRQTLNEVENLYFRHSQRRRLAAASTGSFYSTSSSSLVSTPTPPHPTLTPDSSSLPKHNQSTNTTAIPEASQASATVSATPEGSLTPSAGDSQTQPGSPNKSTGQADSGTTTPTTSNPDPPPPMASLSPSKSAQQPYYYDAPNPYAHYPARVMQYTPTPAGFYNGGAFDESSSSPYSPQRYLAKAYVSSSPFPINAPASPSAGATTFGATNQALTYDSFWSTHASWGVHAAASVAHSHVASAVSAPGSAVASGVPIPVSAGGQSGAGSQNSS